MISPSEVVVDRTWEEDVIDILDTEISREWGTHEHKRIIQVEAPISICTYIERLYAEVGWQVWARASRTHDASKWTQMEFGRPGSPKIKSCDGVRV